MSSISEPPVRHRERRVPPASWPACTAVFVKGGATEGGPFLPEEARPGLLGRTLPTAAGYEVWRWQDKTYRFAGLAPDFPAALLLLRGRARGGAG